MVESRHCPTNLNEYHPCRILRKYAQLFRHRHNIHVRSYFHFVKNAWEKEEPVIHYTHLLVGMVNCTDIPVRGRGGPQGFETSRLPRKIKVKTFSSVYHLEKCSLNIQCGPKSVPQGFKLIQEQITINIGIVGHLDEQVMRELPSRH
jgi:hypothetical protein